jgi:hypothetical protein
MAYWPDFGVSAEGEEITQPCPPLGRVFLHSRYGRLFHKRRPTEEALMPLKWRPCEWRSDENFEGGLGSHPFCLVYQHRTSGMGDGQWV